MCTGSLSVVRCVINNIQIGCCIVVSRGGHIVDVVLEWEWESNLGLRPGGEGTSWAIGEVHPSAVSCHYCSEC